MLVVVVFRAISDIQRNSVVKSHIFHFAMISTYFTTQIGETRCNVPESKFGNKSFQRIGKRITDAEEPDPHNPIYRICVLISGNVH